MSKLLNTIENSKKIAIFSHIAPDADALCSSFALKNLIMNNFDNKFVDCFIDGEISDLYQPVIRNEVLNPKPLNSYDLAIVLDCPNLHRIGRYAEIVNNTENIINIDHHETNEKFGTINMVAKKVSSTCELIALIGKSYNLDLNNVIAKYLYQGIITDTNCFTSSTMSRTTHVVLSELLKYKFDADTIRDYYFKNNSIAKTRLLTSAFRSLKFYKNGLLTTMKIANEVLQKTGASFEDTLGIADNGINIDRTEISAILIEKEPNYVHVSLRSKGKINVGEIAKQNNGGGNEFMAAFQKNGNVKEIEQQLVEQILPYLENIQVEEDEFLF